jgi:hypothetical protein
MIKLKETPKLRLARIAEYWSKRCELAEKCLEASPCDPDITEEQALATVEYHEFIRNNQQPK